MHVHPDIAIDIVDREHRSVVATPRRTGAAVRSSRTGRRARLGTAVVRLGARLGRLDVVVVTARRGWRGRTAAA